MNKHKLKNDILLTAALLLVAAIAFVCFFLFGKEGDFAVVTVDGKEIARYSLSKDMETDIISNNGGVNTLVIKNGEAFVSSADCPDKICVSHRKICRDGETIVCLPHRLVVSIEPEKD